MDFRHTTNDTHHLGDRRELWVDDVLLERKSENIRFELHRPVWKETILTTDMPWEGNLCNFATVLHDPTFGLFRLYYRGGVNFHEGKSTTVNPVICLSESSDGIHWSRASKHGLTSNRLPDGHNAVVAFNPEGPWYGHHGFSPFIDANPEADPEERYKAIGRNDGGDITGLFLLISPDGVNWHLKSETPIFRNDALDSQNVLFFDSATQVYRLYFRKYFHPDGHPIDFAEIRTGAADEAIRGIMTSTSDDLESWTDPVFLNYGDADPLTQLYSNNIHPYYRAPHLLLGFPARYVEWTKDSVEFLPELEHRELRMRLQERLGTAVSDGLFMASRNGRDFKRYDEAFFRPGLRDEGNWAYGDNFPAWGMLETISDQPGGGKELSLFTIDNYWRGSRLSRHTSRIDGFVSLNAPLQGGEIITKPFVFTGSELSLNFSASAAGCLRVEILDQDDRVIPGYEMDNCVEVIGDSLDYRVHWRGKGSDVSAWAGHPTRLRLLIRDADWYSWRFT